MPTSTQDLISNCVVLKSLSKAGRFLCQLLATGHRKYIIQYIFIKRGEEEEKDLVYHRKTTGLSQNRADSVSFLLYKVLSQGPSIFSATTV